MVTALRRWGVTELVSERVFCHMISQFYCQCHSFYMDPRRIEEDRDASLAFWEMEPRMFDGTQGAAALDMETIFRLCHIGAHLQVMLASRRLTGEARKWRLSLGDLGIPTDEAIRQLRCSLACLSGRVYGGGLPPEIMQFTLLTAPEMTLDKMIEAIMDAEILANWVRDVLEVPAPIFKDDYLFVSMDDAGMGESVFHGGPFMLEEPIPAVPIQKIPPQEEDAVDAEMDLADQQADLEEVPDDPPLINITSDDEDEIDEEFEEDPKEILFKDDEEWDVFSDVTTE
ncbi:hypothetical protein TIFTF001_034913 [Ficus carica]|uniref:Uncharacterized protein n=1 Tax=Ficus carica TaxID=3494 RepID=A0AA88E4L4_FICCA|nr:hypothetical protein TIFTF001_034913 [Ficus carica]